LYWKDTIEEIRRNNPELEKSIKDAKDTFVTFQYNTSFLIEVILEGLRERLPSLMSLNDCTNALRWSCYFSR
jgi:hypothetical protein